MCKKPLGTNGICAFCDAGSTRLIESPLRASEDKIEEPATERLPSRSRDHSAPFSTDGGRFVSGTVIADRYRIIGLLGRGGMGDVYRADDLKLVQSVALKFLPATFSNDPALLARFNREVSIARQVSHPNICRVFDVGESGGDHFISMEYIDGEDIRSLLRRIGRFPPDKANETARQICAGLAAAHDSGVFHRDLKPANVMIDGRGMARITDFGLAVVAEELHVEGEVAGTPAYMSPEQLSGKSATAKSDIYSLGLLLYEIYTGKRAYRAETIVDYALLHEAGSIETPSSIVKDLDPAIERVILRCVEIDPDDRPASALHVAAALPGGDPLHAALAAGELPSPGMVAAAGGTQAVRPMVALSLLLTIIAGLALTVILGSQTNLLEKVPVEIPPEVLKSRAREVAASLGYAEQPADRAWGMGYYLDILRRIDDTDRSPERWERLRMNRPAAVGFWYRESPRPLVAETISSDGKITYEDPPATVPGAIRLHLDSRGNLTAFEAVPALTNEPGATIPEIDWGPAFRLAGLEIDRFEPSEPQWVPRHAFDRRGAWVGSYVGQTDPLIRVEAAAWSGKIVQFEIVHPWDNPDLPTDTTYAGFLFTTTLIILMTVGALALARKNYQMGKGDLKGAFRLALFIASVFMLGWLFSADLTISSRVFSLFTQALASAIFLSVLTWVFYMALEPLIRRRAPETMIAWTRLLQGRLRDPLVGRSILLGLVAAVIDLVTGKLLLMASFAMGATAVNPLPNFGGMLSVPHYIGRHVTAVALFTLVALVIFFLIFLFRRILRWESIALPVFILVVSLPGYLAGLPWFQVAGNVVAFVLIYVLATRVGLLSLLVYFVVAFSFVMVSMTLDLSTWYAWTMLTSLGLIAALAFYSFRIALGGQPLFERDFLES